MNKQTKTFLGLAALFVFLRLARNGVNGIGAIFENSTIKDMDDLRKQYYKLCKIYHPDTGGTHEGFLELTNEYEMLRAKILNGSTLTSEEKNNEIVIDENLRNAVDAIRNIEGITIEIIGRWIWVSGLTYPIKDFLKAAGFTFIKKAGVPFWVFKGVVSNSRGGTSMDDIRNKYGSKPVKPTGNNKLNGLAGFSYHLNKLCKSVSKRK